MTPELQAAVEKMARAMKADADGRDAVSVYRAMHAVNILGAPCDE